MEQCPHRHHLIFRLFPFRLQITVGQQSSAGIETATILDEAHTSQRHEEMGIDLRVKRTGETAVISPWSKLIVDDEVAGCILGQATHRWRGIKGMDQVAHLGETRQDETEMLVRILSFDPVIRVVSPDHFIELIRTRLEKQKQFATFSPGNDG